MRYFRHMFGGWEQPVGVRSHSDGVSVSQICATLVVVPGPLGAVSRVMCVHAPSKCPNCKNCGLPARKLCLTGGVTCLVPIPSHWIPSTFRWAPGSSTMLQVHLW
jgi:hypothetical protein